MVDQEVESTLREIRERVRQTAALEAEAPHAVTPIATSVSNLPVTESAIKTPETMARIDAYLATTARAWDRLPPLVSNRSGGLARLELWVKRRFKQATRWYSWEQINFNAAVHHALRDALDALLDLEQQIGQVREQTTAEIEARAQQNHSEMMTQRAEIESLRDALESQRAALEFQRAELESQRKAFEFQRTELESQRKTFESLRADMKVYGTEMEAEQRARSAEVNTRLGELARELRERDGELLDEQRVCFKQLSLEMSEAEVLLDRSRRDFESRLEKLEGLKRG